MRVVYFLLTGCMYILSLPLQAIIAVTILCLSGHPVIFLQERVGKNGKRFIMYKFRTMINGADELQEQYHGRNESKGPVFKIHNDPRFTGIGRFLSHTGLDELPQLYNVIRGDMAFIGPRPLPVSEAKSLAPWMRVRHNILPGVISPAILTGKYHKNFTWWMKSDVTYARKKTVQGDTRLIFSFLVFIFRLLWKELTS